MEPAADEFAFLPAQATALGVAIPRVERVSVPTQDGREISALRFGDSTPTMTLVHGAGLNAHTWDATILAAGVPALAIDLPGHGDSTWRADADYRPETLAPDVIRAITTWTRSPQLLVGHSLGGLTAAVVAASRPDLVSRLVIIDITPSVTEDDSARVIRDFFAGPGSWKSRDQMVDRALEFGLGGSRQTAERGVFLNSRQRPDGRWEWKHHFAELARTSVVSAVSGAPRWDHLSRIAVPTLLVRGEHGFVSEDAAAEMSERVASLRVMTVNTGHNVHEERPDELATILRDFGATPISTVDEK